VARAAEHPELLELPSTVEIESLRAHADRVGLNSRL